MTEDKMDKLEEDAYYIVQQIRLSCADEKGHCYFDDELKDLMNIVMAFTAEIRKYKWAKDKRYAAETRH